VPAGVGSNQLILLGLPTCAGGGERAGDPTPAIRPGGTPPPERRYAAASPVWPSLLAAAASLLTAWLTWRRSRAPGLRAFVALCLCTAWWSLFHALGAWADEPLAQASFAKAEALGMVAAPLVWLAFAVTYAGRGGWLRRPGAALLPLAAALALALGWMSVCGPVFAVAGAAFALWSLTTSPRRAGQMVGLVLGSLVVLGGYALDRPEVTALAGIPSVPAAFTLAAVVFGVSLFRPRLLHVVPVARSLVVEGLSDGVIVLDGQDRIVDCNAAAEAVLAQPAATLLGSPAHKVLPPSLAACLEPGAKTQAEIVVDGRSHECSVTPLGRSSVASEGRVLLLRDATARRRAEQELTLARVELQHANAELQHLVHTDPLTGLRSRRFFLERLAEEIVRTRRHRQPLSLLMIDLDHFKNINDRWGHVTGDQILATVAALVRSVKRETDLAGRLGGEEFALMLPATDTGGARLVAERLIARLRAEPYDSEDGTRFSVTASMGVASLEAEVASGDALVASAVRALHRAKEEGRDRVAC
jgi:diguanylate cyclase (GGDEF)-like protein